MIYLQNSLVLDWKQTWVLSSFHHQISPYTYNVLSLCVILLPQVNGIFRPSSQGLVWESLWPLCSFSPKTTKTEDAQMPERCCGRRICRYNGRICLSTLPELNSINSSKLARGQPFLPLSYRWVSKRFPLFVTPAAGFWCCPPVSLSRGLQRRIWEIDFDLTGDFLLVSERCRHEEEDDLISQLSVERVDSNSGAETRQGQKKGSGRWNQDRNTAGCHSGTWTKILYIVTEQGEGLKGLWCIGWRELGVCVIVYHISIDHSHPNWKHWAAFRSLIDFFFLKWKLL